MADNPVWPDTLPPAPFFAGSGTPDYQPADSTIRTSVTSGPSKLRRRFTAVPETLKIQLWLTQDQVATLKDFVENQVQDVLPFDWQDFRDGSQCSYRFSKGRGSLDYKWDSGIVWLVTAELEKLP